MIEVVLVAMILVLVIGFGASPVVPSTNAARGNAKHARLTHRVYFPTISVPRDGGIDFVRVVITCGHVAAVTRIPDDWYVQTLLPAHESGPEWADFQFASNAVEFGAGHGVARLRSLKPL